MLKNSKVKLGGSTLSKEGEVKVKKLKVIKKIKIPAKKGGKRYIIASSKAMSVYEKHKSVDILFREDSFGNFTAIISIVVG
ncbi:MAG: hypothetical protein COX30_02665 [Candidatus Moranbacteria bacterium CG23_combo_of_CG06-09_8_20_14_all_39_10]|nr:MAG: hypothetical protein COX30_02665 [Candidatus Moranbacteria bacterium CG23_combo_of_CG06-09_8_20_14_all_39_10]